MTMVFFGQSWDCDEGCESGSAPPAFLDFRATVEAAAAMRLSIPDYVEDLWDMQGQAAEVLSKLVRAGLRPGLRRVLEIGPGTGRFLHQTMRAIEPDVYEIYEIAEDWARWLEETHAPTVVRRRADGRTLSETPDRSCDFVHAHGVFVYLLPLNSYEYFAEMTRVCTADGLIAFDYFPAEEFGPREVGRWLATPERFAVPLERRHVLSFFRQRRCSLVHRFHRRVGPGRAEYLLFHKAPARRQPR